jgi:hypothetical protein
VLPAQNPFGQQQFIEQHILVGRITAPQKIFDSRMAAGQPGRFEFVTKRVHSGRWRRGPLVV